MNILVTGANGFIGKNLRVWLTEQGLHHVTCFEHEHSDVDLANMVASTDLSLIHI